MKYRLHPLAKQELQDAILWYEAAQPGLGAIFFEEYQRVLSHMLETPLLYPQDFDTFRKAVLSRFPYSIYYQATGQILTVYSVFHHKRSNESRNNLQRQQEH